MSIHARIQSAREAALALLERTLAAAEAALRGPDPSPATLREARLTAIATLRSLDALEPDESPSPPPPPPPTTRPPSPTVTSLAAASDRRATELRAALAILEAKHTLAPLPARPPRQHPRAPASLLARAGAPGPAP
jgi:hypothetical protein